MNGTPAGRRVDLPEWLRDELNVPLPEMLWHYTTQSKLEKILGSGVIWATDVRCLKDEHEFIHALQIASSLFDQADFPKTEMGRIVREYVEWEFAEGSLSRKGLEVYVASFTPEGDLLSQWEQYARGDRGVAVGIDLTAFRLPAEIETFPNLRPRFYDEERKQKLMQRAVMMMVDEERELRPLWEATLVKGDPTPGQQQNFHELASSRLLDKQQQTSLSILVLAALFKNKGFRSESEWRLALPIGRQDDPTHPSEGIRFEGGSPVSYLKVPLAKSPGGRLPIVEVMYTPYAGPEAILNLRRLLSDAGYADCKITSSEMRLKGYEGSS